jgi:predicted acetyltransferase
MRVGRSILRVAGLTCLAVDPAERGSGHGRALIQAALSRIGSADYQLSVVFAESDELYGDPGWETLPIDTYAANLDQSGDHPANPDVREMDPMSDLTWVAAVHGAYGASYAGPLVRTLGWWSGNMKWMLESPKSSFVLAREGRIVGYARARYPVAEHGDGAGDFCSISDLAAADEDGEKALLTRMVHDAKSRGFRNLSGQAPVAHRAVKLLRGIGTRASVKSDVRMKVRLVDLKELLEWLRPEFAATLSRSSVGGPGTVGIRVGSQSAEISHQNGAVEVSERETARPVELSEAELWALIFKGRAPPRARGNEREVIETLFRKREFAFWRADAF